jgi:DNA-binding response OmpR family regulator
MTAVPRVLVADDDSDNRALTVAVLTALGLDVIATPTGDAALRIVRQERLDALLLDVRMPGLSGLEVCERLRGDADARYLPILLISASAAPAEIARGFAAGADDYLVKPFRIHELARRVTALLADTPPTSQPRPALLAALSTRAAAANRPVQRGLPRRPLSATG